MRPNFPRTASNGSAVSAYPSTSGPEPDQSSSSSSEDENGDWFWAKLDDGTKSRIKWHHYGNGEYGFRHGPGKRELSEETRTSFADLTSHGLAGKKLKEVLLKTGKVKESSQATGPSDNEITIEPLSHGGTTTVASYRSRL